MPAPGHLLTTSQSHSAQVALAPLLPQMGATGPPPPAHLRRLFQAAAIAQAVPGATGSSPQPEPPPPPLPESSGAAGSPATVPPAALLVPVLLSAAPGGGGVAINASSGAVVDAGGLNIIRCLRYAAGFNASSGLYAPPGDGAGPPPRPVALPPGSRPPLNLTRCISRITVVATRGPTLTVQVGCRVLLKGQ